jgi:hypothetical protein
MKAALFLSFGLSYTLASGATPHSTSLTCLCQVSVAQAGWVAGCVILNLHPGPVSCVPAVCVQLLAADREAAGLLETWLSWHWLQMSCCTRPILTHYQPWAAWGCILGSWATVGTGALRARMGSLSSPAHRQVEGGVGAPPVRGKSLLAAWDLGRLCKYLLET